jgi:hypothetical protein
MRKKMPTLEQNINKRLARLFGMRDEFIDRMNGEYDRELVRLYQDKLNDIKKELSSFIGKLDSVTIQEARRYNRLVKFETLLQEELSQLGILTKRITRSAIKENAKAGYYTTGWTMEEAIGIDLKFKAIDDKTIRAALINPMDAIGWPDRTADNINILIKATRQAVTQGLVQGSGYRKTAAIFKDKMEKSLYEAQRVIHTETQRARTASFNDGFDHSQEAASRAGVDVERIWDATLDGKTRPSHQALDQTPAGKEGFWTFPGGVRTKGPAMSGVASEDINCRCAIRVQVIGMEPKFRKDNETKQLVEMQSYSEWQKKKGF